MFLGIYLIGMFLLLHRTVGDKWIAAGVTVASVGYYETIGAEIWGVAGASRMLPRTIFTAFAPYLFLVLLALLEKPSWWLSVLLGFGIGLSANLHPTSGLYLTLMVISLILFTGFRQRSVWLNVFVLGGGVLLGAAPMSLNFIGNTSRSMTGEVSFASFSAVVKQHTQIPFRPLSIDWPLLDIHFERPWLDGLVWLGIAMVLLALIMVIWGYFRPAIWHWLWLGGGLAAVAYGYLVAKFNLAFFFWVAALYIIYRFRQRNWDRLDGWLIILLGLVSMLSFVGYYIVAWVWETFEVWRLTPLLYEQVRAARFIYLPLYLLVGRAGFSLAVELTKRWSINTATLPTVLTALIGLELAWGGVWSELYFGNLLSAILAFVGGIGLVIGLVWLLREARLNSLAKVFLSIVVLTIILVCFGPLAPLMGRYFPVPTYNLWGGDVFTSDLAYQPGEVQLYTWVQTNTSPLALFYPCNIDDVTRLRFRYNTGRSLTHAKKDLNLVVYDGALLVDLYKRYDNLIAACKDPYLAVKTGRELQANFILSQAALPLDIPAQYICFANDNYKVITLSSTGCQKSLGLLPLPDKTEVTR